MQDHGWNTHIHGIQWDYRSMTPYCVTTSTDPLKATWPKHLKSLKVTELSNTKKGERLGYVIQYVDNNQPLRHLTKCCCSASIDDIWAGAHSQDALPAADAAGNDSIPCSLSALTASAATRSRPSFKSSAKWDNFVMRVSCRDEII